MSPRRRQQSFPLPNGIRPDALPAYVYWDRTGRGRWVWRHRDETGRMRSSQLGGAQATLHDIWDAYQAVSAEAPSDTLAQLVDAFEASPRRLG